MRCDRCGVERTVIVTTTIQLHRTHPTTGRTTTETRITRLCVACGGADGPEELRARGR